MTLRFNDVDAGVGVLDVNVFIFMPPCLHLNGCIFGFERTSDY